MSRLAFLRMIGLVPMARYGSQGQMHRRPDQQTDAPPSAVAPTQAAGIVRARLVLIFGTGANTGLFVYNGSPGKGNLVAHIVPPGVTTDPYGNSVSAVANFGTWNASGTLLQHFGINSSGDTFLVNSSGLTVVHEHSADGAVLFYNTSGEAAGNLVASVAPAAGTDGAGNHYIAGYTVYNNAGGVAAQLFSDGLFEYKGSLAGGWTIGSAAITSSGDNWVIAGNQGVTLPVASTPSQVSNSVVYYADANGVMRVINGLTGDNNVYGVSRVLQQVSPRSQLFNSTSPASISGLLVAVAAGTYIVRCRLLVEWQSIAGVPQLRFAGPGINQFDVSFKSQQSGTNSNANNANTVSAGTVNGTGYNGNSIGITGAMSSAGIFFDVDIWGMFNFSASGTLALQASSSVAADSWNVISGFWEVMPV